MYEFVISNDGVIEHELRIIPPADEDAMGGMGMHSDEMHNEALFLVEKERLQPGQVAIFEYTFPANEVGQPLEFACHLEGHYEGGMRQDISVVD